MFMWLGLGLVMIGGVGVVVGMFVCGLDLWFVCVVCVSLRVF
jgi:hypothetical protein